MEIKMLVMYLLVLVVPSRGSTLFEAAFQGKCGSSSPCEQLCFNLHDGTFECDCQEGYVLDLNGYSCLDQNATNITANFTSKENSALFYEKDVSFVARLDLDSQLSYEDSYDYGRGDMFYDTDSTSQQPYLEQKRPGFNQQALEVLATESLDLNCDLQCGPGRCYKGRCLCPLGLGGDHCDKYAELGIARFKGTSWVEFPVLQDAYKDMKVIVEFRPESWDGVIMYAAEVPDLEGDFTALILREGWLEFRFDCGSGMGVVRSDKPIVLHEWNQAIVYRHRWDVWMQLNNGTTKQTRSKGVFSRITFEEPLYVGGSPNFSAICSRLEVSSGFHGCVRRLDINDKEYSFQTQPAGDAVIGLDVDECTQDLCISQPCKHGGKCIEGPDKSTVCLCALGFMGELCETPVDLEVPSFNGSSYLKYPALGTSVLSFLEFELVVKPRSPSGILLYNGQHADGTGDFLAITLRDGKVELGYDLGDGPRFIRSNHAISLNEWHRIQVSRTGRRGVVRVDEQEPVYGETPGAFTQLSLSQNLYLGGLPKTFRITPLLEMVQSFEGCIQKVVRNNKLLHILATALSGVNVGNCEHACVREPCLNGGMCIPMQEDFACHCPIGYRDARCSSSLSLNTKAPMLTGASFLHFTNYNITKHFENGDYSAIEMQFRCLGSGGLLVWAGAADKDYLGIGLQQGFLHFRYNLGSGEVIIRENRTRVDDGHWHTFIAVRRGQEGSLMVDERDVVTGSSPGHMRHLNSNTGLYIGGVPDPTLLTLHKYRSGFLGCVSELVLSRGYTVSLISQASDGRNVDQCV